MRGLRHGYRYKTAHFIETQVTNLSKVSPLVDKKIFRGEFGGHLNPVQDLESLCRTYFGLC